MDSSGGSPKKVIELAIRIDGFEETRAAIGDEAALQLLRKHLIFAGDTVAKNMAIKAKTGRSVLVTTDMDTGRQVIFLADHEDQDLR